MRSVCAPVIAITISSIDTEAIVESGTTTLTVGSLEAIANPNAGVSGGIVEKEMPIDVSNVMVFNPKTGKGDRVGFKIEGDKKVRIFKSNNEVVG